MVGGLCLLRGRVSRKKDQRDNLGKLGRRVPSPAERGKDRMGQFSRFRRAGGCSFGLELVVGQAQAAATNHRDTTKNDLENDELVAVFLEA